MNVTSSVIIHENKGGFYQISDETLYCAFSVRLRVKYRAGTELHTPCFSHWCLWQTKDFIISAKELIVPVREGIIVDPQLKQTVLHSSTSHRTSSLVVFHYSERDVSSSTAKKPQNPKRSLKMVVPHWFSAGGATAFILQWSQWLRLTGMAVQGGTCIPFPVLPWTSSHTTQVCAKEAAEHPARGPDGAMSFAGPGWNPSQHLSPLPAGKGNSSASADSRRTFSSDLKYWLFLHDTCHCFFMTWSWSSLREENLNYFIPV